MTLRRVLLLVRDVPAGVKFFGKEGLGLPVVVESPEYAEMALSKQVIGQPDLPTLALQAVEREADCSTGYSPLLNFDVDDMDDMVGRLLMQGARLDGPIKYPPIGKLAAIRSPCGHMVGLFEANPDLE
mmetsp:Transcript_12455/g.23120  ORF Transcript_12455/g.23120 Transcript_12455/m.23120 type:complete len:128 (+) Transcript_12455:54-437(+)